MKVPYANCDFANIRREGYFYVDKTPFLPRLEATTEKHVIFLRPRRFGKSTFISTLENYYDILLADKFDEIFGGLWIHENPTPSHNKYLVLTLDFSPVDTAGTNEQIHASFAHHVREAILSFITRYITLVPTLSELHDILRSAGEDAARMMSSLLRIVGDAGHQLYLLIDEYDHFGNRLLSDGRDDVYRGLVRSAGFVRSFYASLKAFTRKSTIARTFITGVSPIMLDDLSSGFNIISHISNRRVFNAMAGFTRADVERAVDTLLAEKPRLAMDPRVGDRDVLLATLATYYDGYRFSPNAAENMYNSTLVLYFLAQLDSEEVYPRNMLDLNVRTDYGRLYGLVTSATAQPLGTRELLEEILTKGIIDVPLVEQFGTAMPMGYAQIASLFYYMGMLTFGPDTAAEDVSQLVIPNRVMRELQWTYMSLALRQHDDIRIDLTDIEQSLSAMAKTGDIQPLVDVFQKQVLDRVSNKDLRKFNEKAMKLMLMAYICQTQVFHVASELEMKQGYCDLLLGIRGKGSSAKYAWIIEAKYVPTKAKEETIEQAFADGYGQIERYVADEGIVQMLTLGRELKAGVLLFQGTQSVRFEPWPRPVKRRTATKKVTSKKVGKSARGSSAPTPKRSR